MFSTFYKGSILTPIQENVSPAVREVKLYIDLIAHPVDQSKSLASFLQTLWSRLPGDPAILAFLQPGLDGVFRKEKQACNLQCKPGRYTSLQLSPIDLHTIADASDASASKNAARRYHISGSGRGIGGFGLITAKPNLEVGSPGGRWMIVTEI